MRMIRSESRQGTWVGRWVCGPNLRPVGWVILPWAADLDGDGDVDDDDFAVFKQCYKGSGNEPNSYGGGRGWIADLDCDGDVDGSDYVLFAHCYNGPGNAPRHPMPDTLTAVVLLGVMAQSRVGNPYFFTGRELDLFDFSDANTPQHFTDDVYRLQLYHYRARFLLPDWGRFGQVDPLGYFDGMNLYEYVMCAPTVDTDPTGLMSVCECTKKLKDLEKDPDVDKVMQRGRQKKNRLGLSCFGHAQCLPCAMTIGGFYNPITGNVGICSNNLSSSDVKEVVIHEVLHAISMCGNAWPWILSCAGCMTEEIAAYYHAGQCSRPEDCARMAWRSCNAGGFFSPCAGRGSYRDYIPTDWPPKPPA